MCGKEKGRERLMFVYKMVNASADTPVNKNREASSRIKSSVIPASQKEHYTFRSE